LADRYVCFLSVAFSLSLQAFVVKRHSRLFTTFLGNIFILFPLIILLGSKIDSTRIFVAAEVIFVLSLIVSRLSRPKIILRLARNDNPSARNYLNESFRVAFLSQYGLSIHLLIVLALFLFSVDGLSLIEIPIIKITAQLILLNYVPRILRLNIFVNKSSTGLAAVVNKKRFNRKIAKSLRKI
jgi:hypothetical protein